MEVVRTPDERFASLPGFPFAPNYAEVDDLEGGRLRMHFLDEGAADGEIILLLHGEPSWSYLYRHMIPVLVDAGYRCIAPDLVGFGRSDKPIEQSAYSYERSVSWLDNLVFGALDLDHLSLVCQDWGGLLGLRLVAARPERFDRVVVANTGLPRGNTAPSKAFLAWQSYAATADEFPVGKIVAGGCQSDLSDEVVAAYDAPFPDDRFTAGARVFPSLVPTSPDDPSAAANSLAWETLRAFDRPFLCAFSDGDPISAGGEGVFIHEVPGCAGQAHVTIEGGGHFLQEDRGIELAEVVARFVAATS